MLSSQKMQKPPVAFPTTTGPTLVTSQLADMISLVRRVGAFEVGSGSERLRRVKKSGPFFENGTRLVPGLLCGAEAGILMRKRMGQSLGH